MQRFVKRSDNHAMTTEKYRNGVALMPVLSVSCGGPDLVLRWRHVDELVKGFAKRRVFRIATRGSDVPDIGRRVFKQQAG
jgi:hypothetical protein